MKSKFPLILLVILAIFGIYFWTSNKPTSVIVSPTSDTENLNIDEGGLETPNHPLTIAALREGFYPGSDIIFEETLSPGSNYQRHIVSYLSEGLKIYALLTVPIGEPPVNGWPVIVFNHGYIQPAQYRTTERYVAYVDGFARNGYIVLKSDYRGHGNSEGMASGGYGSHGYTIDVLNAISSIKKYPAADSNNIGLWGHSMGGPIVLKIMVTNKDVKAGVIWAGVVGSYADLLNNWRRRNPNSSGYSGRGGSWRQGLVDEYGTPEANPEFWNSISATSYLSDISGPLQLHHGTADSSVPIAFSQTLNQLMLDAGKEVEFYNYAGDDHNLSGNFSSAMTRSIEFFDKYLK